MPDTKITGDLAAGDTSAQRSRRLSRRQLIRGSAQAAAATAGAGLLVGHAAQPAMAAATVDSLTWGAITVAPGGHATWWFTWGFHTSPDNWIMFWATPDNWPASVMILQQWAERDLAGVTKSWVHFYNPGSTYVVFRPIALTGYRS
jgi:hypothetical protein